jgi:Zn-dependent protease with chaperone function
MLTPAELSAVLAHEWGHVRQRDPLRLTLLRFWSTALWFVPIVRVLARDSARAMEDAADDAAVCLTDQPLELAAALVKIAKAQTQRHWSPVPAIGGEQVVSARVERLLALTSPHPPRQPMRTWIASAGITVGLLGLLILPRQPLVAAMIAPSSGPQPSMMTCHMDTQ